MSYLSNWWNLRKLKRMQRETRAEFAKKLSELKQDKSKTSDDYNALLAEEYSSEQDMQAMVNIFHSDRLLEQAAEYDVEIPLFKDNSEFWQYNEDAERYYLSASGRALLRDLIQKEDERNFEKCARWAKTFAPIIGALAGLFGVITGLVAVLQHKK